MKKIFFIIMSLFLLHVGSVFAKNGPEHPNIVYAIRNVSSESAVGKIAPNNILKADGLKSRADFEIKRRINSLQKLITRINRFKRLSAAQKSDLISQVQKQIDSLNALNVKIDADTDAVTLKTDVKSIITDYRIYAFFIQYINLVSASERIETAVDNLTLLSGKLQTRISEAQSKGQDVSTLNGKYQNMQTNLSNAKVLTDEVNSKLSELSVSNYPANKTDLEESKTNLKQAFADLKNAYQDGFEIIRVLKELKLFPTLTPTPTPSV